MRKSMDRRQMFKGAGKLLGAGALAAVALPTGADAESDPSDIAGLWAVVVSSPGSPSFPAFESWGSGGTWTGSGQPDLTPAALGSTAWGAWTKMGDRMFHLIARFWTYSPTAVPTGFAAINFTYTLSADGKTYHGVGTTEFYDTNNHPLGPPVPTTDDGMRIA